MKILFLDVDGPLIPTRLHVPNGLLFTYDCNDDGSYKYDREAIKLLNEHCFAHDVQIVFNTAHNTNTDVRDVRHCAINSGMHPGIIHDNYKTDYPEKYGNRVVAINAWLSQHVPKNTTCSWMVIDDMPLMCHPHQEQVTLKDGIRHVNIINAFHKLVITPEIVEYKAGQNQYTQISCHNCEWKSKYLTDKELTDLGVPWYCDCCGARVTKFQKGTSFEIMLDASKG